MLRNWRDRRRQARKARAAADLQAWHDTVGALLAMCQEPLRSRRVSGDIGVPLDRIDRTLMRFRNESAAARSALRTDGELTAQVRAMTDGLFELRNQTVSFMLRWQTAYQLEERFTPSMEARRAADEARLVASRSARRLADDWKRLAPLVERLIGEPRRGEV